MARPGTGTRAPTSRRPRPALTYRVRVTTPGTYAVWLRGLAFDRGSDSAHVGVDGVPAATAAALTMDAEDVFRWTWFTRRMFTGGQSAFLDLTAGEHTINVWAREDGLILDRIVLDAVEVGEPQGAGPPQSPPAAVEPS